MILVNVGKIFAWLCETFEISQNRGNKDTFHDLQFTVEKFGT